MRAGTLDASDTLEPRAHIRTKREQPWIWVLLSSIVTLLLGLMILAHWPVSSVYVLGIFLGIDLVMAGAGWIGLAFALRHRGEPSPATAAA